MVHEFGHYSNLAHTAVNGQIVLLPATPPSGPSPNNTFGDPSPSTQIETMYPFYFGAGPGTASPHHDDIVDPLRPLPGAVFLDRHRHASAGTIFGSNGTTRLSGVNVIARNVANPFDDAVAACRATAPTTPPRPTPSRAPTASGA